MFNLGCSAMLRRYLDNPHRVLELHVEVFVPAITGNQVVLYAGTTEVPRDPVILQNYRAWAPPQSDINLLFGTRDSIQ